MYSISCEHVCVKREGYLALDDISFCVKKGEYIGIIGPNGAGKTTLLLALLGIIPIHSGQITISADERIGYVPQKYFPNNSFPVSVREILSMGFGSMGFHFWKKKQQEKKIMESLELVGLSPSFASKNFTTLSGGQKQRVIIARALIHDPTVLFFDEPTSGIDHRNRIRIHELLSKLNKEKGITILFVSHEIEHIIKSCKRILCLDRHLHEGCAPMEFLELGEDIEKESSAESTVSVHHVPQKSDQHKKHDLLQTIKK